MTILVISLSYLVLILIETRRILRNFGKKEIVIYLIFILATYTVSIMLLMNVKIPSPEKFFGEIILNLTGQK